MIPKRLLPNTRTLPRKLSSYDIPFYARKDLNAPYFRIPVLNMFNDGSLLCFANDYPTSVPDDYANKNIVLSFSYNGGEIWRDKKKAFRASNNLSRMVNPTIIYDDELDKIIVLVTEILTNQNVVWWKTADSLWDIYVFTSTDRGKTWTKTSIKSQLLAKRKPFDTVIMGGLGTGVKMKDGTYVFPIEIGYFDGTTDKIQNGLLYSNDLTTWNLSESVTPELGDEANIVLLDDTTILLNARNFRTQEPKARKIFITKDLGATWQPHQTHQTIPESRATMGHTYKIQIDGEDYIIFSHMQSPDGTRKDLGISVLKKDQSSWVPVEIIEPEEYDGYSCLAWNKNYPDYLFLVYEKGGNILCKDISYLLPKIKLLAG